MDNVYKFRNLPCYDKYANKQMPWCVVGEMLENGKIVSGGVLEWCYDEMDANEIMNKMKEYPESFTYLCVTQYHED